MKSSSALSAQWMSSKTSTVGPRLRQPLEEHAPAAKRFSLVADDAFLEPEQVREARLDEATLLADRGDAPRSTRGASRARSPAPRPRQFRRGLRTMSASAQRRRPRRRRGSGRECHQTVLGETVHVLLELPREPRLADAGDPDDRDEVGAAVLGGRVEELLHEPELAVAAHERRLEPGRPSRTPDEPPITRTARQSCIGSAFPFSSCVPASSNTIGGLRRSLRRLSDEDRAGLGRRLDARGGVDEVAGDHALRPPRRASPPPRR